MRTLALCTLALGCMSAACYDASSKKNPSPSPAGAAVSVTDLPGHAGLTVDTTPKQSPRTLVAESYLRTYQMLFGNISPREIATAAKGTDGSELFDRWSTIVGALGLPEHSADIARATETNTVMLAAYERLGIALCDRAVEHDLRAASATRHVFDFSLPADALDRAAFDSAFDRLHRTFLGYPSRLASGRSDKFFALYKDVVTRHQNVDAGTSKLSPPEAGWAVVCYGLVRHPEFHLY